MSMLGAVYAIAWQQRAARGIEAAIMCRRKVRRGLSQTGTSATSGQTTRESKVRRGMWFHCGVGQALGPPLSVRHRAIGRRRFQPSLLASAGCTFCGRSSRRRYGRASDLVHGSCAELFGRRKNPVGAAASNSIAARDRHLRPALSLSGVEAPEHYPKAEFWPSGHGGASLLRMAPPSSSESLLSAALRHADDARVLHSSGARQSEDQAWHLAGFAVEIARKSALALGPAGDVGTIMGHDLGEVGDVFIEAICAQEPIATRYRLTDLDRRLAQWSPNHRYDGTGAHTDGRHTLLGYMTVNELVALGEETAHGALMAMWLDNVIDPTRVL